MAKSAEYNLGEFTFPRGWFVVAQSAQITSKPYNARYFGEDVVIFRGASGKVAMLGAYCPHMGTHFGASTASYVVTNGLHVEGDNIRCPFHAWRFGADGKCNNIPYFDGPIPEKARVKSWPVEERYGIVFCWNDPEGLAPGFDIPEFPEWDDPTWVRWTGLDQLGDLPCHPIEIFDNNSDSAHLNYTHGSRLQYYENEIKDHRYHQRTCLRGKTGSDTNWSEADSAADPSLYASPTISTVNSYHGPGLNAARFIEASAAQLIAATPIDDGSVRLVQCAMLKSPSGVVDDNAFEQMRGFNKSMIHGLAIQDGEIWATKRAATQILQIPTDGPFNQARTWYSQFFNPRSKTAEILKRVSGVYHVRGTPSPAEFAASTTKNEPRAAAAPAR